MDSRRFLAELSEIVCGRRVDRFNNIIDGFPDAFEDLFGGVSRARESSDQIGFEDLKKRLAKMPNEVREEILKSMPEEVLKKLGYTVVKVNERKRPEWILAESELAGNAAQITHLQNSVNGFFIQDEKSTAAIKKLKKEKKKLEAVNAEQTDKIRRLQEDVDHQIHQNNRLGVQVAEKNLLLTEAFQDLRDSQVTVEQKSREIVTLASTADSFAKLQNAVIAMDASGNKSSLFGEIGRIQALAVAMQQKDNNSDVAADETLAAETSQEKSPEEDAGVEANGK